ncbi:MAG: helix-turn-helix domain-containing protein [Bacteroidota bacterium]
MDLLHAFGDTLKQFRKKKSWSQEELADYSGLDRTYISLLERGLRNPTLTTLFSIAKCMDYQPNQFIKEIENKMESNYGGDINED